MMFMKLSTTIVNSIASGSWALGQSQYNYIFYKIIFSTPTVVEDKLNE